MKTKTINRTLDLSCLLLGAISVLGFAPFNLSTLLFFTLAGTLFCWLKGSAGRTAWRGLLFGLGFFGCGASWVFVSIHHFGGVSTWLALIFTGGFVLLLAAFICLQAYLFAKLFPKNSLIKVLIAFPTLWVLFEWIREWFLTGFPWLYLGTSQVHGLLAGFAPIVGTFGTSWLVALGAALVFIVTTYQKKPRYFCLTALIILFALGIGLNHIHWTHKIDKPQTVSLVQGNIAQSVKWNPNMLNLSLNRYQQLTSKHWQSSLIIWPENSIPLPVPYAQGYLEQLAIAALKHHSTVLAGIPFPVITKTDFGNNYYNGLIAIGNSHGHYYKRHLVPFGEYVPFENLLRGLIQFFNLPMSSFVEGPAHQPLIKVNKLYYVAPFICYEVAYSSLVRSDLPKAAILITISDDAWFGHSVAAWQHLQIGQMQALSTGREMLFDSNNGVTAFISDKGRILKQAPRFVPTVLTGKAVLYQGETPWVWLGNWPVILLAFLLLLLGFCLRKKKG